jgi:branched-chain amino acid transport system substrate-binding protein
MRIKQPRRLLTSLLAVVGAASLIAACGSSSTRSPGSAASASAPTGPAGAAIKVGFMCSCSGPQAAQESPTPKVAAAWADSVNAAGGINGHRVELKVLDDGSNPATGLQNAKKLVEQEHVIAIIDQSLVDASWASYVAAKGIPALGGLSQEAPFLSNPNFFPSGTQLVVQTVGTIALAKTATKTHIGVMYCAESPICAQLVPLAKGAAALSGLQITTEPVSATAPSYTAVCLRLKSAGVDAMFVGSGSPVVVRVTDGCAQQGYKPQAVNQSSTASQSWLTDNNLDGILLSGTNANPFDDSTPGVHAFRAALDKYAPGLTSSSQFNFILLNVWAGGKLFEAAATAAHLEPSSTGADLKKGLYALKNETLGGVAPPLNFTPGKPAFVPCYFTSQLKSGKFASLNGDKPTCLTPAQSTALIKALHLG